ncbi:MAG TPA: glutathione S-transferase family protein [Caulobacteraceae bacterium]|nr:glutathione S-transferase family protein [Caulobacteraceae bacterium]
MPDELVFYTNPMSRGRIVRWMLEEVGAPYRTEIIDYDNMKSAAYLAINPMAKVPSLRHREVVVTECAAICAYLADAFPEAGLAPPMGDHARGAYFRWLFFAAGPIEAAMTDKRLGVTVTPEQERMVGYRNAAAVLDVAEAAVAKSSYVAGERFTAADVYFGSQIGYGMMFGGIDKRPAFERYWQRVSSRPAAIRANEIDGGMPAPQAA